MCSKWCSKLPTCGSKAKFDRFPRQDEQLSHVYHDSLLRLCPWVSLVGNKDDNEYDGKCWSGLDRYLHHRQQRKLCYCFPDQHKQHTWEFWISLSVQRIKFWKANTVILMLYIKHSDTWLTVTALSRILSDFM